MKLCRVQVSTFCLNPEQADLKAKVIWNKISGHSLITKKDGLPVPTWKLRLPLQGGNGKKNLNSLASPYHQEYYWCNNTVLNKGWKWEQIFELFQEGIWKNLRMGTEKVNPQGRQFLISLQKGICGLQELGTRLGDPAQLPKKVLSRNEMH